MSWWLRAVPWSMIISNAPAVLDGARRLLEKRKAAGEAGTPADPSEIASRLAALEQRERRMLELIESLATSNQQLIEAIDVLRRRARIAFGACAVLAVGLIVCLVRTF